MAFKTHTETGVSIMKATHILAEAMIGNSSSQTKSAALVAEELAQLTSQTGLQIDSEMGVSGIWPIKISVETLTMTTSLQTECAVPVLV